MAITGTGTEQDPYIVHDYSEFISLSGSGHNSGVHDHKVYIQFFENNRPNQVIDCNNYGSEFKWGAFTDNSGYYGTATIYINLNGCTIKNFLIADGITMFEGHYWSISGAVGTIVISNGSFRNVFMGSSTSKVCGKYVEFHDVSMSVNVAGSETIPFNGDDNLIIDNCAIYLVASTLNASLFNKAIITDTDLELHIANQNGKAIFNGNNDTPRNMQIHDCRLQGKISGSGYTSNYYIPWSMTLGALNASNFYAEGVVDFVNCVIDIDFTESDSSFVIYTTDGGVSVNTNIICDSHYPEGVTPPSSWNYMSHENIRNGTYLNNAGFTVVEVAGG